MNGRVEECCKVSGSPVRTESSNHHYDDYGAYCIAIIYVATPDDFRTLPVDCTQALLSLCVCVVLLLEPTYKSAAVVCILLLYRNVTCNSHATCNINTT